MRFPSYPEYKTTDISWLRELPRHWQVQRLKTLFNLMKRPPHVEDAIVTAFRDGEVTLRANRRSDGFTNSIQEIGYQGIRRDDLVIHAMDAFAGAIGVSDSDGKSTPVYSVCEPHRHFANSHYYANILRHMALCGFVNSLSKGIRERSTEFRWAEAGNVYLPVPPLSEQVAIVKFILRETAKIDALISEQERLITLLAEKRQATISHAVTKGLNPNVPMKDSGVEWVGEVPEHWTTAKIKQVSSFITSGPRGWSDFIDDSGDDIFLQSGDLNYELEILPHQAKRVKPPQGAEGIRTRLEVGDVVVCITGANTGRVAVVDSLPATTYINQHLSLIRPTTSKANPNYIALVLASNICQTYFEVRQYGLKEGLSLKNVADAPLPLPDIVEQSDIVSFVRDETSKLAALNVEASRGIALLKERRSALISAAVTGKIDVRPVVQQAQSKIQEAA